MTILQGIQFRVWITADGALQNVKEGDSPSIGLTERPHLTSATVSQLVHALGGLPGYVDQLEKTIDIKDMKIQLLENEVARYVLV